MTEKINKRLPSTFGARVRELREQKGWSQEEFARFCKLHRTYIGSIERGERNVSLKNIVRLAKILNVPVGYLFREEPQSQPMVSNMELLEFKELCGLLRTSHQTVYRLIKAGLPSHKIGGKRMFLKDEVLEWVRSQ